MDQKRLGAVKRLCLARVLEAARRLQRDLREEGRARDADLRIGRGDVAFRGGDVGAALQERRRNAGGHVRYFECERLRA